VGPNFFSINERFNWSGMELVVKLRGLVPNNLFPSLNIEKILKFKILKKKTKKKKEKQNKTTKNHQQ
jgi:hypothetical protein